MKILDYIPVGRNNAIAMLELSERLGVDPRTLRALIYRERRHGAAICSDWERGGYYQPENEFEARLYYRQQMSRIKSARAALNGITSYLRGGRRNG